MAATATASNEVAVAVAGMLSRFIVMRGNNYSGMGNAYRNEVGSVVVGENDMLSTAVKIEAEQAEVNQAYVHLRFCESNRYWSRKPEDGSIAAVSKQRDEDVKKESCTLFKPTKVQEGVFFLSHVQSGGQVLLNTTTKEFYVDPSSSGAAANSYMSFVNWDTLVKLPKNVAFKGLYLGDKYLQSIWADDHGFLQFAPTDPNLAKTRFEITMLPDGYVRIRSDIFNRYWRRANSWIWADSTDTTPSNANTVFWPVKIDDNTVAFRSLGNGNFIQGHNWDGYTDCLNAAVTTITDRARIGVQELVSARKIYNVIYRMDDSRIYNETVFIAGTTTAYNYASIDAGIAVEVGYEDQKSYSITRSLSLTAGVTTTIEFGVPLIASGSIQVSYQISGALEWNNTTTSTTTVRATGSVPVPPWSMATVSYVGTMGTCDVPFSYTQQDTSSTDGTITTSDQIDGVFKGVNAYNFSFVINDIKPLA